MLPFPIYHVAAESAQVKKAGGMGDVVSGLTKELHLAGVETAVVMPKYDTTPKNTKPLVSLEAAGEMFSVFSSVEKGIQYYFIESEARFNRSNIYGYKDDLERFGFFALAAAALLVHLDAQIIHLHDWQAALIAVLFKNTARKTILTIHNLLHQGHGKKNWLKRLQLEKFASSLTIDEGVNVLRGGILSASIINTVSPTYAKEILSPPLACNLEKELSTRKRDLSGILNGIDARYWNPAADPFLEAPYTEAAGKRANRIVLQRELGIPLSDAPLVTSITRFDLQKGPKLIAHAIEKTRKAGGQFLFVGVPSTDEMQALLNSIKAKWSTDPCVHIHTQFNERLAHIAYAAADFIIIPSLFEPCGLTQMLAMRYGTLPIARKTGGLADTIADGNNGFLFEEATNAACSAALERAFALTPTAKQKMQERAMQADWSWNQPAQEYISLYTNIC